MTGKTIINSHDLLAKEGTRSFSSQMDATVFHEANGHLRKASEVKLLTACGYFLRGIAC